MLLLRTLGELRLDGCSSARLSSPRKELTLLTYLARRAPKAVGRDKLAELLWGERDTAKARQSLRQALLELKRIIGEGLETGADRVGLVAGAVILDAVLFERDLAGKRWAEAIEHWRGDFLADIDDLGGEDFRIWLEAERENLRRGLRLALLRLVEESQRNGAWKQGISWAERWVELLPLDEEGHRHLIELTQLDGRTTDALTQYAAFRARLRATDSEPTPALVQLGQVLERHATGDRGHHTPGSAALFTPDLVGRGPALAELLAGWERVRAGTTASILVEGEAGIGKTRLCEEFLRQLAARGPAPVVLRARGHESPEAAGHGLFSEMLAALVSAPGLAGASPRTLSELGLIAPGLRDRFPGLPEPYGSQPALEGALVEALTVVSEERPLVVYIDDLPRADRGSQRLLRSVMTRISAAVLFLMTARTGDEEPSAAYIELASESHVRRLKLQVLGQRDVEALIGSMLELPASERQRLARRLHAQGGGNPFYTIELTAAMVDEELLTPTESGSWRLAAVQEAQLIPLPATIREVVSRRLDRLSGEVRRTVEAAAVLGRTFDADLTPSVSGLGTPASGVALQELIARRMVRETPDSPGMYEFTHEIICRVAYDQLAPERREALHRSAAKAWQPRARRSRAAKEAQEYHRVRAGSAPQRLRWVRRGLIAGSVAALAASAAFILTPPPRRASLITLLTRKAPALVPHRIVVAPLVNHTTDTTLTGLGALAADWIAQGLMRTTLFEVVDPRTTTLAGRIVNRIPGILRDRNPAIAIAEETGSGTVVSGDLFQDGDSLRVLMRVIDAGTGKIVRAVEPVSGVRTAPSRLVADIGQHVLAAVASAVDTTSRGFSAALGEPPSYEAYTEVSKAWESFFRDDYTDVFQRLKRATVLDTSYMTPLLMEAYVETRLGDWPAVAALVSRLDAHLTSLTPAERAVLAGLHADLAGDLWGRLRAARELMSLTPASVEGYTLAASSALFVNRPREATAILSRVDPDRGLLLVAPFYWVNLNPALHRLGDYRAELETARQGLRRFPDRSWPHMNLLIALAAIGDIDALRREFSRVAVDDPDPALAARQKALWVWRELRAHGHPAAAAEWLSNVMTQPVPTRPDSSLESAMVEGDLLSAAGRWTDAARVYTAALPHHPDAPALLGRLGVTAAHRGDRTEALRLNTALVSLSRPYLFGSHTYARARIQAALGQRPAAVELLRSAWAQGRPLAFDNWGNDDVHSDPEFEPLRDFFPFQMLMRTD